MSMTWCYMFETIVNTVHTLYTYHYTHTNTYTNTNTNTYTPPPTI